MLRSGCLLLLVLLGCALPVRGQEEEGPPGWLAEYRSVKGDHTDTRIDRLAALHVPAGLSASPFLPAGPFRVTWKAFLPLEFKGDYTFLAQGRGKVRVEANGVLALDASGELGNTKAKPVALKKGDNALVVVYESPATGDAEFRLQWQGEEFRQEPLGLKLVHHVPKHKALLRSATMRQGRDLLATYHCLKCHTADTAGWVKAGGMSELEADAPALTEVGTRLRAGWLARWVQDPQSLRPQATMPRMFSDIRGDKLDPRARDIAAYLATLGKPDNRAEPAAKEETVNAGLRLFANLGCIGCHLPPDRDELRDADHQRLPLRDVSAKWRPAALREFLRQPDRHYSWIRMPNFQFTADEAAKLSAYLLSVKPREAIPVTLDKADAANGKKLVQTAGCLACHLVESGKGLAPPKEALAYARLDKERLSHGCLSAKPGAAPAFPIQEEHRQALAMLIREDRESPSRDNPTELERRQLVNLRCNACHKRDGQDDLWTRLKEENDGLTADLPPEEKDDKFPAEQVRPPLTWVGEKLRPEWTTTFLSGKLTYRPRPYLKARMPAFPRRADILARGLAMEHGYPPTSLVLKKPEAKMVDVGMLLAGKRKWGCVGCHQVGDAEAVGVFEAPGVNFAYAQERLRREYFDRWLWSPTRVEPGTKMPTVYNWGKESPLADVLDGDAFKQVDALWHYLQSGRKIKAPAE